MKLQQPGGSIAHKLVTFFRCAGTFAGPLNVLKYVYLKVCPMAFPKQIRIKIKALDRPLVCRPKTSDIGVLLDTFKGGHHRLPSGMQLPANAVIFDLGANVGFTVLDYASRYPGARIIAVEMDHENFKVAIENTRHLGPRCTLLHAAVWTDDGEISYEGAATSAFHICDQTKTNMNVVRSRSLMSIIKEFDVDTIDYLKMDIEGAEREVLQASMDWAARVKVMQIEAHSPDIMRVVSERLSAAGFRYEPVTSHPSALLAVRDGIPG